MSGSVSLAPTMIGSTPTGSVCFVVLSRNQIWHVLLEHSYDCQRNEKVGSDRRLHSAAASRDKPGSALPTPTVPAACCGRAHAGWMRSLPVHTLHTVPVMAPVRQCSRNSRRARRELPSCRAGHQVRRVRSPTSSNSQTDESASPATDCGLQAGRVADSQLTIAARR
jgi:hypothetical protein